jgi:serine O-acetyltransferase
MVLILKKWVIPIKINDWLNKKTAEISDELIKINFGEMFKDHISSFGMKQNVYELIDHLRRALYPHIYETDETDVRFLQSMVNKNVTESALILNYILQQVFYQLSEKKDNPPEEQREDALHHADTVTMEFIEALPKLRAVLSTDVKAAYRGDPAAVSYEDVILSYPCMEAITIYRAAHELWLKDVPLIPRIMTEYAHAKTGIDIHPGASIGTYFFIDHGTGVVIGETCEIGDNVKLYQGVTLGAKSFETDEKGTLLRKKRHPNIEDNVIIYSGATILGGDTTVGHDSVIGGNVWLTNSVPPYSKVYNSTPFPIVKAEENEQ